VTLAATAGAVAAVVASKGLLMTKGIVATKAVLAATGTTAVKTGAVTLPTFAQPGATVVQQTTGLLSSAFSALTHNAAPLTAGAVGGGAAGWGVTQSQIRHVEERLDQQSAQTAAYQAEAERLQTALAATTADTNSVQNMPAAEPAPAADRLEVIHGIGPTFARRLNEAGIFTFADLAAQTPEQLRTIMANIRASHLFNPEAWIAEAQTLVSP
jgi:predicted flap endonuclease-1-like 5' DNA nuclease